jgi:hypothetical protein
MRGDFQLIMEAKEYCEVIKKMQGMDTYLLWCVQGIIKAYYFRNFITKGQRQALINYMKQWRLECQLKGQ